MGAQKPETGASESGVPPSLDGLTADSDVRVSERVVAALPACIDRLLTTAVSLSPDEPLEVALARLLDELVALEPDGAAALELEGGLLLRRGSVGAPPSDDHFFPDLPRELSLPLPGAVRGRLAFAAPSFTAATHASYERGLSQAAAIFALCLQNRPDGHGADRAAESLAQLDKLARLGQNASAIVHELNNPLTAILAYSDYLTQRLRRGGVGEADLDRMLRIHESAVRIQEFCRDLNDYARPSAESVERVDLGQVLDRALRFCVHGLRAADIAVERSYQPDLHVLGVESSLTQVFVNLITNAWHAMADRGGVLRISTSALGDRAVIVIADDGPGILEANIHRIFDRYFTTKPRDGGVGLGLSIVRQIVAEHGGAIGAANGDEGGAVFSIELPRSI